MTDRCCPTGSEPALSTTETPKGKEIDLDGLKCYVNGSGDKSIIVFYDIFGYNGGRTKLICDQIADQGYYVILPDIYHGDAWPAEKPKDTLMEWLKNFPWKSHIEHDTNKVLEHLKAQGTNKAIGCLGFCAGAFSVFHLCQRDEIVCGASMHPSVQIGGIFGDTPEGLAEGIKCPQLVYPAGGDPPTYKPGGMVYQIIHDKFGAMNDMKEFPEMNHGWVSRGNIDKPEIERDFKLAMEGLLSFYKISFDI